MKAFLIAVKGKGLQNAFRRLSSIASRYGITSRKMDLALGYFGNLLTQYNAGASFPITAAALARSKGVVEKYQEKNIEFAVHGFHHVDHSILSFDQQISDFTKARKTFGERGISSSGFRSPYLRYHDKTIRAISETGFIYDSSSSLHWDVLDGAETDSYRNVLEFYGAQPANIYPALPRLMEGIVEIPYGLPDDESLVERLSFNSMDEMIQPWLKILEATYQQGELFTLGLHPERIYHCEVPLTEVLVRARKMYPKVWIARLDEIARWWMKRATVKPVILSVQPGEYLVKLKRIQGLTVLGRDIEFVSPSKEWDGTYRVAQGNTIQFRSNVRPFIGVSLDSDPTLSEFLRQQGFIIETAQISHTHSVYLDYPEFSREDEKSLLNKIENHSGPLLRFGRWPNESKSALCVTGDIDALTIWDYLLRAWRK